MSGGIAGRGKPGNEGPQGPMGPTGPQGPAAFTLAIGEVSAVPYGGTPSVVNTGTDQDQVWAIAVPTGATGVLTGPSPPTGTEGTSLGQLYFCTANQAYYALVELHENDNKWRPLMTQDSAMRTYKLDMVAVGPDGTSPMSDGNGSAGYVTYIFDDVERKLVASVAAQYVAPIGGNVSLLVDRKQLETIKGDAALRGITEVPCDFIKIVNGVQTSVTVNLISVMAHYGVKHLAHVFGLNHGTGSAPGTRAVFKDGEVAVIANETSPGGATEYGDPPTVGNGEYGQPDDGGYLIYTIEGDADYVTYFGVSATVVIPYA